MGSNPIQGTRRVGRALASPRGCNPPANAVQVQLLPDTLDVLVVPAEWPPVFQAGDRGFESRRGYSQVVEWQTRSSQKAVPTGREGSSPSLATFRPSGEMADAAVSRAAAQRREGSSPSSATAFRGRLTAGRRTLNPQVLARLQPPELDASMVKRNHGSLRRSRSRFESWSRYIPGVWRKHAAVRRRRLQVRLLPGILWPNPKRQRDPAVNRACVGSTPTGHPESPALLDRPSTALVRRTVWVRVPPLALRLRCSSKVEHPAEAGRVLVRLQPPELTTRRVHDVTWQPATLPWWMRGFKSPWTLCFSV